jgi:MFS family permease
VTDLGKGVHSMSQPAAATSGASDGLVLSSGPGRWVLLATVLGSAIASIDATVVGIALPAIGREFHASLGALQWVVTGYTLTLAGLLLLAGALGDKYGRKRVFVIGVSWFAIASLLCAVAPSAGFLIGAHPDVFSAGFHTASLIAGGLCVAGGVLAAATIRNPSRAKAAAVAASRHGPLLHCALDAPPQT